MTEAYRRANADFMAEFAHDLCSPVSAIYIIADLLRSDAVTEEQGKHIDTLIRLSDPLLGMVNDFSDWTSIEPGHEVARMASCDLHALVHDVLEIARLRAADHNLSLVISQDPAFPRWVSTDSLKFRRALMNVLDNAVKYTRHGSVTVSLNSTALGDPERVQVSIHVRDTGIGIAAEDRSRIFERTVRVPGAPVPSARSGLGLAIAARYVALLGGSIQVESAPGKGSCFHIELPVVLEPKSVCQNGGYSPVDCAGENSER